MSCAIQSPRNQNSQNRRLQKSFGHALSLKGDGEWVHGSREDDEVEVWVGVGDGGWGREVGVARRGGGGVARMGGGGCGRVTSGRKSLLRHHLLHYSPLRPHLGKSRGSSLPVPLCS